MRRVATPLQNAPWSRGPCSKCGAEILLARGDVTYGARTCGTCEVDERAEQDFAKRVIAVVAELRQVEIGSSNPYMAGVAVGYNNAADLVAKKLGVEP